MERKNIKRMTTVVPRMTMRKLAIYRLFQQSRIKQETSIFNNHNTITTTINAGGING